MKLTIQFFLNSRNATKFRRMMRSHSGVILPEDCNEPSHISITRESPLNDLKFFVHFWGMVKKYKDTSLLSGNALQTREQSEKIFDWIQCSCNREYFPSQSDYCFISPGFKDMHGWGCKCLHSVVRHAIFGRHRGIPWYRVGPFDGKVQYIDKQDIRDKLMEEIAAKSLSMCNLFSIERMQKYIDQLPAQIDPTEDDEWEYECSSEPEAEIQIIGVKPKPRSIFDLI